MLTRRDVLRGASCVGATVAMSHLLPGWARSAWAKPPEQGLRELVGTTFDLDIGPRQVEIDGRRGDAVTINGTVPGPLLRWREGDTVEINVTNRLHADTSIHWHGILLPPEMDGVPGVSFPGIKPGETFRYHFPLRQAGTYWFHSHSGLQEQIGHYGALIIDPAGADPVEYDREHVIVLSDWTFENPHRVFARLKKMSDSYNLQKRTLRDFFRDASRDGFRTTWADRRMWGAMRMNPTDIADVTAATYTYLVNGHGPLDNWTGLFVPGERVRLRIINASAMTIFNVRIPGLPMTVVQSDGLNVRPVEVDELQIGTAETYDAVVTPTERQAFTLMCESIDRSGFARATLTPELGMVAEVPPLRERPLTTMRDMGMAHHGHGHGQAHGSGAPHSEHGSVADSEVSSGYGDDPSHHESKHHGTEDHGNEHHGTEHQGTEHEHHGSEDHGMAHHGGEHRGPVTVTRAPLERGPGVANVAEAPMNRLHERGIGLEDVPHRVLVYTDLESLEPNPDRRLPGRELELHLTSNMERYMWSFDGVKFSERPDPITLYEGERVRLTLVNDTMMAHPVHLHGMFFEVVNGGGGHRARKHTIIVKPGEKLSLDLTADEVGDWAFHCHLLYHMHAGMMRVVSVQPSEGDKG